MLLFALLLAFASLQSTPNCALNPQAESICQPSMFAIGTPVVLAGECPAETNAGTVVQYYRQPTDNRVVYVVLLDGFAAPYRGVNCAQVFPR